MTLKYGYEQHEWDAAKAEMREALVERAKLRGMIPYSELVEKITTIELEPNSFALAAMLGEVSTEEAAADRGMLSVLVVHKVGDMQPGPGFFELAGELRRDTSDILKCWVDELKKVHRVWSGK
jgi:molybdopterin synthase catalytic subunit